MADGVFDQLTIVRPRDHHSTARVCQDWASSVFKGQHMTLFYDCIEKSEHSQSNATSSSYTGLWIACDDDDEDFNESACVKSPGFPEEYPINRLDAFPSFQASTECSNTVRRNLFQNQSSKHVCNVVNQNCTEIDSSEKRISSNAQSRETFYNNLQELNYEEKSRNLSFIKGGSLDFENLHSNSTLVSRSKIRFDNLTTIDKSVLNRETNIGGAFILTSDVFDGDSEKFAVPDAFNAMSELQHLAADTLDHPDSSQEIRFRTHDKETSGLLVGCCGHKRLPGGPVSGKMDFPESKLASEECVAEFSEGLVKGKEIHWWDVDEIEDPNVLEAGEQIKDEKSLNFNSNAEDYSQEEGRGQHSSKLSDPSLIIKVKNLREKMERLLLYANLMLAWNLIQLLVLFGTLFYAFVCICHFRQAFGCNELCLLKPKHEKDVRRTWWDR